MRDLVLSAKTLSKPEGAALALVAGDADTITSRSLSAEARWRGLRTRLWKPTSESEIGPVLERPRQLRAHA